MHYFDFSYKLRIYNIDASGTIIYAVYYLEQI